MSGETNWKNKYLSLKARYLEDVDMAFRLGYEDGAQKANMQAQQQQMQQQQADMQAQQAALQGGQGQPPGMGGDPSAPQMGEEQPQPGQESQEGAPAAGGSELDQHIGQLESMIAKGEMNPADLMKAVKDLQELRKSESESSKRLKVPVKLGAHAQHNLPHHAKEAVTLQHKIVADVMKSFKEEEVRAANSIKGILAKEGLLKSEE